MTRSELSLLLILAVILPAYGRIEAKVGPDIEAAREAFVQGFYLEAETNYERYLQKQPKGSHRREAWNQLLDISLYVNGDVDRSVMLLEAIYLEFGSDHRISDEVFVLIGDLYEQQGNLLQAVDSWEKSLAGKKVNDTEKNVSVFIRLARAKRDQRNFDGANQILERCTATACDPEIKARCLYESAQNFIFTQSFGLAQARLDTLLTMQGVSEESRALAIFLMVDICEHDCRIADARKLLESINTTYPNSLVIQARLESLKQR